ncbi:hypothetical protein [Mycoplasmopsis verecunda]|uniref:Uncharacterized protein n=1 Tax=Mycoplasmopsis verecunda TaxID=171291 RepID=A0A1T4M1C5_9BACT|nr:hypothetical protein [Mycoplasmopsis verecunda]WPB54748.1 hypothetical protein SAM46_01155 [Mycoplasmopsis verecunda]SJZ60578.1 hypothetical protein SAMN02745154_00595 [Mycoplasmopsis verecunda]
MAKLFDASQVNNVIKVSMPASIFGEMQILTPLNRIVSDVDAINNFTSATGYGLYALRTPQPIDQKMIGKGVIQLPSIFQGLAEGRYIMNYWDLLIFGFQNIMLINQEQIKSLNVELYIGIDNEVMNKIISVRDQAVNLENQIKQWNDNAKINEVTLPSGYDQLVKNFLVPKYSIYLDSLSQDAKETALSETEYYKQEMAKYIITKDDKQFITQAKLVEMLNNVIEFLKSAPAQNFDQQAKEAKIAQLENDKAKDTEQFNNTIQQIDNELKNQQDLLSKATSEEEKAKINQNIEGLNNSKQQTTSAHNSLIKALDYQITQVLTITEWINKASQDFELPITKYEDIATYQEKITKVLDTNAKELNDLQNQLSKLDDQLTTYLLFTLEKL